MANYTCIAENLAGKRISDPALLTVFGMIGFLSLIIILRIFSVLYYNEHNRNQEHFMTL